MHWSSLFVVDADEFHGSRSVGLLKVKEHVAGAAFVGQCVRFVLKGCQVLDPELSGNLRGAGACNRFKPV